MENNELPTSWVWTRLGEISNNITKGSTPTSYGYSYKKEGIKFIKTENIIENGAIENVTDFIDQETNLFLKRSVLQPNDILFSIAGTIGRVGIVQEKHLPANTNQALSIIRCPWSFIDNKYISYFLKSPFIQRQALKSIVGVGRANISLTNLGDFLIPLPPLPEQRRILTKLEELFTRLDAGVSELKKTQAQLKRYRQSVLKTACEGKLVLTEAELAKVGGHAYEPADVLLARILKERRENWNGRGKYKEPAVADTSELPSLPEGWKWVSIDQISTMVTDGDHNPPKRVESGIPHLTAKNIKNWQISEEDCTYINKQDFEKVRKRYFPLHGDIIITCVGTIGRTAIVPENYIFSADRNLAVVRLISEGFSEKLMLLYLNTPTAQISMSTASGSTAQPHLYLSKIRVFPVPLPPLAEQRRIVLEVERRLSIADGVEKTVTQSLAQAERLRQSILKKAFEGRLVAQDASDEPAGVLLERIQKERELMGIRNIKTGRKHNF